MNSIETNMTKGNFDEAEFEPVTLDHDMLS